MTCDYLWVLNPDCERELAAKHSYAVRAAFRSRISERRPLFEGLVQGEPMVFAHELGASLSAEHKEASADRSTTRALVWCPTPHLLSQLAETQLIAPAHPDVDTLRRVHNKCFLTTDCRDLALPGRTIISTMEDWSAYVARTTGSIRTKRFFGYAGKGQRVWSPDGKDDRTWLTDSLRQGGFIAEPNVLNADELSLHGFVDARGCLLGQLCALSTDRAGAPVAVSQVACDVVEQRYEGGIQTRVLAEQAAERLSAVGYFGPFGIDLLWVGDKPHLIDVNPRFTLGWSIGMGALRAEGIQRVLDPQCSGSR